MVDNKSYTYVLEHDTGFAPNPFFGYLTLAACKPLLKGENGIRKDVTEESLKEPVWIFANGGRRLYLEDYEFQNNKLVKLKLNWNSYHRLVYAFRVDKILTFENYYNDPLFSKKKRINSSSQIETFGDNNLHCPKKDQEKLIMQYTEDPIIKITGSNKVVEELPKIDIKVNKVLISAKGQFYYFGCFAPNILEEFEKHFLKGSPNHKLIKDEKERDKIIEKIEEICPKPGIYGFPSFNNKKEFREYATNKDYLKEIYHKCFDKNTQNIIRDWISQMQTNGGFKNSTIKDII